MKKLLLIIILLFMPSFINAEGVNNYKIETTILDNGDLLVEEWFDLTGEYNGFERIIDYKNEDLYEFDPNMNSFGGSLIHNGNGLEIVNIGSYKNNIINYFKEVNIASKGDYGVYTVNTTNSGKKVLIYNPSNKKNGFYLKYIIKNIAIKHNDIAELGWNAIGSEFRESINNLEIIVNIPNNTNVRSWAHGPINGNVEIISPTKVKFNISGLFSYTPIDVRLVFDLDVIKNSSKFSSTNALDKIINYETSAAEQANYERQNKEKILLNEATSALALFEVNIRRYYYEKAKNAIEKLSSNKEELVNKLETLKKELDIIEEKEAYDFLEHTQKNINYDNYKELKEKIYILDNVETKNKLIKELEIIEQILKEKELKKERNNYIKAFIYLIILVFITIYVFKNFILNPNVDFKPKYYREIDDELPTNVSYLIDKNISNRSISASILDLIRRKIITVEKIDKKNYRYILNEEKQDIPSVYRRLIKLIFCNNKNTIETKEIKKYSRRHSETYYNNWEKFKSDALATGKSKNYFELKIDDYLKTPQKNVSMFFILIILFIVIPPIALLVFFIYLIYLILKKLISFIKNLFNGTVPSKNIVTFLLLIIGIINIFNCLKIISVQKFYNNSFILFILIGLYSFILIMIFIDYKRRTIEGTIEFNKWIGIKNFLNDFGNFKDKDVIEIELWEKYLVFATLFGCSKKILKNIKLEELPNMDIYTDTVMINSLSRNLIGSYVRARNIQLASSSSGGGFSSSSGGGGGFSSGGGSFGGGGGGGRF